MKRMLLLICVFLSNNALANEFYNRTPHDFNVPSAIKEGSLITLSCEVRSKPAEAGKTAEYPVKITNISNETQKIKLSLKPDPWAVMPIMIEPNFIEIPAGQSDLCTVKMTAVDKLPKGGQEKRTLIATPNDAYRTAEIDLATVRFLEHPYMFVDNKLIEEIKEKINKYDWAKTNFQQLKDSVDKFNVPKAKRIKIIRKGVTWYGLYPNYIAEGVWKAALVWEITGETKYRDKVLEFIKDVADPNTGYRTTRWATNSDAYVHEGEFFTFYGALYDVMHNEQGLTEVDHKNIQDTMRLYLKTSKGWHVNGDIGNWDICANVGGICCAAAMQDMAKIEECLNYRRGFYEQISLGLMDDGWWLEGASNYNYLVARYYSYAAKSVEAMGINLFDAYVPARYFGQNGRRWRTGWMSMNFDIWGPPGRAYRCLKDLYDGSTMFLYENGYAVANNDSDTKMPGDVFELGYYHYKDPTYLWMIKKDKRMTWQSLVYGIGDPGNPSDPRSKSAHSDNIGLAALRSQKPGQTDKEQIQAFLKWGSHGGWHGHFDRASFSTLRRYETDLLQPRASFFGYSEDSYKAWVQPSISHNMVVVDKYQQEPVESKLLMFYAGSAIQAAAVETNARWTEKLPWSINNPGDLDATNMAKIVNYGDAEPVLQRRLMIVTDDYVLVSDYLKGQKEHTFDWLVHPVGYVNTVADNLAFEKRTARISDSNTSSYYYITDCNWYTVSGNVLNKFKEENVNFDIHTALDSNTTMAIGTYPYSQGTFSYSIVLDGNNIADKTMFFDSSKVQIINIPVKGAKELKLVFNAKSRGRKDYEPGMQAIGEPKVILADGSEKRLFDIKYTLDGIKPSEINKDYKGENISIAGKEYSSALMVEPQADSGTLTINLEGLNAESFVCEYGADDIKESLSSQRRTLLFRSQGNEFRFVSLFAPYLNQPAVESFKTDGKGTVIVQLKDGRKQEITIEGFEQATAEPVVIFKEFKQDQLLREEKSK